MRCTKGSSLLEFPLKEEEWKNGVTYIKGAFEKSGLTFPKQTKREIKI